MSTFAKVLLATDFTPQSDNLTGCLFSLCPDTETEVVLAHVFEDDDDADPGGSKYKKASSRLTGYKNDLEQAGYENISVVTPVGDTCKALNDAAVECGADLMLVASHGKNFLERALMGSTTYELAQEASLPLLINKEDEGGNGEEPDLLSNIMVPTDFSKKSLEALNIIRSLREHVGKVLFVHIIERGSRSKHDYKDKYSNAALFLQELVDEMKIFGIKADFCISKGVASKQIAAISARERTSMIMMARTGLEISNFSELGSTSKNVVLNAECAVLLLPAEDNEDN